jgi:hypothetical protein
MRSLLILLITPLLLCSCGQDPSDEDTGETPAVEEGKADTASERHATASGTTLWINTWLSRTTRSGQDVLVLEGRTSRNLIGGFGFVCDDAYGGFQQLSTRRFELSWTQGEAAGLVSGVEQFARLDFKTSPLHLTGHLRVRPRLTAFSGSGLYLQPEVLAVIVGGRRVYRITGTAASKIYGLTLRTGKAYTNVRLIDDTHFTADLEEQQVLALAGAPVDLELTVSLLSGYQTKRVRLGLATTTVGLSAKDPYVVWPAPACTSTVKTCLKALSAGTLDLGSCGEARLVQACQGSVGLSTDSAAVAAATARADLVLAQSPGFAADAATLVGTDRAAALKTAVRAAIVQRLQQHAGSWYLDTGAQTADLDAATTAILDEAYATPLQHVTPHAPLPGDLTRTRDVVADALLAHLAATDTVALEWGRPLVELTRTYRAWHLKNLVHFRTLVTPTTVDQTVRYIGDWLGALVEVTVDPATGKATNVLLEVD